MKALIVDASLCTGCRTCEVVCSLTHNKGRINPRQSRIRVHRDENEGGFYPIVASETAAEYLNMDRPAWPFEEGAGGSYPLQSLFTDPEPRCNLCGVCSQWCVTTALQMKEL
jgi:benzoyl-CoA reductase subunit BamC